MVLKKLIEGIACTGYAGEDEINLVTDDSRKVKPGSLFVCIKGARFDGHSAAAQALKDGAAAVVCEKDLGLERQIIVSNTRAAYSLICAAFFSHPEERIEIVGVTGTNGKTTACFILKSIFEFAGHKCGMLGTVKNMVGSTEYPAALTTPDPFELFTLLSKMVEAQCEYCFMEVSSQALDQRRVEALDFSAAVFTNLTRDHLDYHGSFENYKAAKKKLFDKADMAIVNFDDDECEYMLDGLDCRRITYSAKSDLSSYTAKNIKVKASGVEYELVSNNNIGRIHFGVPGEFSVYNSMCAAICAVELGIELRTVIEALAAFEGVRGRMEVVETGKPYTVIIDYAHTPDGLENVLSSLAQLTEGKLWCVFGCGGDRDKTKRPIMGKIASSLADVCVVTSDNPRSEDPDAIIEDIKVGLGGEAKIYIESDRTKAISLALSKAKEGDVIVLAGKGHETYQILNTGKIHYDEREIIADILAQ